MFYLSVKMVIHVFGIYLFYFRFGEVQLAENLRHGLGLGFIRYLEWLFSHKT